MIKGWLPMQIICILLAEKYWELIPKEIGKKCSERQNIMQPIQ
jgi:hypothetical protein